MEDIVLIIKSTYYKEISDRLICGAIEYLDMKGILYKVVEVPGALEIPVVLEKFKSNYKGFIIIGCIIRGETSHFDIVKNTVISYIYEIVLKKQIALGMSLLTVENYDQALKRSSAKEKINSGFNAAMVCSKMIEILKKDEKF